MVSVSMALNCLSIISLQTTLLCQATVLFAQFAMFQCNSLCVPTTVLMDLPLPAALPTETEQSSIGGTKILSAESRRLLENTNPTVCSKVAEALLSVDMDFV